MEKTIVISERAPAAVGPYSQAIRAGGFVYTSGQLGLVPGTKNLVGPSVEAQAWQAFENLQAVLEAAGSGLSKVVKCTVFLKDLGDFAQVNQVYATFFTDAPPARSAVQVAALPLDARVEIEAVALVGAAVTT